MGLKIDCCCVISFFGIFFYISVAFIIIGQPQFLRFQMKSQSSSYGACFVVAVIFLLFFIATIIMQRKERINSVQRQNYVEFKDERRERQQSIRGNEMADFSKTRQE